MTRRGAQEQDWEEEAVVDDLAQLEDREECNLVKSAPCPGRGVGSDSADMHPGAGREPLDGGPAPLARQILSPCLGREVGSDSANVHPKAEREPPRWRTRPVGHDSPEGERDRLPRG